MTKQKDKIFSIISIVLTFGFAGFNLALYFIYQAKWNLVISLYYFFLLFAKAFCTLFQKKEDPKRVYFYLSFGMMMILAVSLTSPITLMMLGEKETNYNMIIALADAAYTTYKIIIAILKYKKFSSVNKPLTHQLQIIRIYDALASLMVVQYTLVMGNGSLQQKGMLTLTAVSSFAVVAICFLLEIIFFCRAQKSK